MGGERPRDTEGREQEVRMSDTQRETLGNIARLTEQMSYAAMNGMVKTLAAQFNVLKKHMERLDAARERIA